MSDWATVFRIDPLPLLLASGEPAVAYFARRDLVGETVPPLETVWELPEVQCLLRHQQDNGSWKGAKAAIGVKGSLVETWRQFRVLVQQYQFDRRHPALGKAAEFLFSCQTEEGDIRGILANQYAPYYTGAILSLLIQAGYAEDPRVERGMQWLLRVRQEDGGWVIGSPGFLGIPLLSWKELCDLTSNPARETMRVFNPSRPFSAAGTGMVLRAFAAHPAYRNAPETLKAARLLKSKFFQEDNWSSYRHSDNWIRFQFPFWWNNLVSALDSLSRIGMAKEDPDIQCALQWLVDHQLADGMWKLSYSHIHKETSTARNRTAQLWITLTICRIFQRFLEKTYPVGSLV
ncbi:MAG: hypothetical protein NTV14_00750 [Coprothermobacterota bacterium]|nr:hypothetical protein [Coprothermobacterota bacterium]